MDQHKAQKPKLKVSRRRLRNGFWRTGRTRTTQTESKEANGICRS